jgi:hypothetical protein
MVAKSESVSCGHFDSVAALVSAAGVFTICGCLAIEVPLLKLQSSVVGAVQMVQFHSKYFALVRRE